MRYLVYTVLVLMTVCRSAAQIIPVLKTDEDCLRFIRTRLPNLADFYFDTLFSPEESQKLKPSFKHWQRTDLNGDKKPDLIFTGYLRNAWTEPHVSMACIAKEDTCELVSLIRGWSTSFRPHVFISAGSHKKLIIVHNYYFNSFERVETLLEHNELNREYCQGDDTLVFNMGALLTYSSRPSGISFDSIAVIRRSAWYCGDDSFMVRNDGNGWYARTCGIKNNYASAFTVPAGGTDYLQQLIRTIDMDKPPRRFYRGGTDQNSSTIRIYYHNTIAEFFDYGNASSHTLVAIYRYFTVLQSRALNPD